MRKRFSALVSALVLVLVLVLPSSVDTAEAADLDYIRSYDVTVMPRASDGSLYIQVHLVWEVLDEGPVTWVQVGIPNGSIRSTEILSDNIDELNYDNSYMRIDFDRGYDDGEIIDFSYAWEQEYMYTLDGEQVSYDYTPGWFDEAEIGSMSVLWLNDPSLPAPEMLSSSSADLTETTLEGGVRYSATDLSHGEKMHISAYYESWPTELFWENSSDNLPDDYEENYTDDYSNDYSDIIFSPIVRLLVTLLIIFILNRIISASHSYRGGFGTRYVFVHGLWYPAGRDGNPRPGSVGTRTKPKPPSSSGFGGGSRGGGFGGSGFGGGSHCACASSCACACACACAGGGRAGCSAKNLYGAVQLSKKLTEELEK